MQQKLLKILFPAIALTAWLNFAVINAQAGKFQTRCGWFDNPTPGNYWLSDKDGEWIFGVQGGYQLEDFEFPKFGKNRWVEGPNGSYGYGCACFEMRADPESKHVLEVRKSYSRPLSACRKDKALRRWKVEEN